MAQTVYLAELHLFVNNGYKRLMLNYVQTWTIIIKWYGMKKTIKSLITIICMELNHQLNLVIVTGLCWVSWNHQTCGSQCPRLIYSGGLQVRSVLTRSSLWWWWWTQLFVGWFRLFKMKLFLYFDLFWQINILSMNRWTLSLRHKLLPLLMFVFRGICWTQKMYRIFSRLVF